MVLNEERVDLSIIVVTYNGRDVTLDTLSSYDNAIRSCPTFRIEITVVDNASSDGVAQAVAEKFPHINLIRNAANVGFAQAANIGYQASSGRYILFSNPDIEVQDTTFSSLIELMDQHPESGACTPYLQLKGHDAIDPGSHRGFPTPWASLTYFSGLAGLCRRSRGLSRIFGRYHLLDRDLTRPHKVDVIEGGFFFARRDAFEQAGQWDGDYFLFGEDIDLCYQMSLAGFKIMYFPQVLAIHQLGSTTGLKEGSPTSTPVHMKDRLRSFHAFYDSMKIFYDKHYTERYGPMMRAVVFWAIDLKRKMGLRKLTV